MLKIITTVLLTLILIGGLGGARAYSQDTDDQGAIPGSVLEKPSRLYATFFEYGLQVFDVTDPGDPTNLGSYITPKKQALDAEVRGDYAYVVDGDGGLQIYNISKPAKIEQVQTFKRPADGRAVTLEGNYAYLLCSDSMQIFDVSDPTNAFWITTYDADIEYDQAIDVQDNYAYVACGIDGLKIYDVSDPAGTFKVGQTSIPGMARDIVVSGRFAYIACGDTGLQLVDVSYPDDPQVVGEGIQTGHLAYGVFRKDNVVYVADRNSGLHLIDVTIPDNLYEMGHLQIKGKATGVYVVGTTAFVAALSGDVSIVDVFDPERPSLIKWLRWNGSARSVFATT